RIPKHDRRASQILFVSWPVRAGNQGKRIQVIENGIFSLILQVSGSRSTVKKKLKKKSKSVSAETARPSGATVRTGAGMGQFHPAPSHRPGPRIPLPREQPSRTGLASGDVSPLLLAGLVIDCKPYTGPTAPGR